MIKEAVAWREQSVTINISFLQLFLFLVVVDLWSAKCGNYALYCKISKLTSLLRSFSLMQSLYFLVYSRRHLTGQFILQESTIVWKVLCLSLKMTCSSELFLYGKLKELLLKSM